MRPSIVIPFLVIYALNTILATVAVPGGGGIESFYELDCMGVYNKENFATLQNVCEDCYELYKEMNKYTSCRSNCFKNTHFNQCEKALLLDQQYLEKIIDKIHGTENSRDAPM